jgi:protoporphyrinogen/coproporphyrinogen III oxidase
VSVANGSTPSSRPTVAVVGGGIAGLAAAWELVSDSGPEGAGGPAPEVVVLEAADHLGGKLRSESFAGRRVDVAADAFLARRPEATGLCDELGLTGALVPVGTSGASIWARRRLRPMPDGLNLGVPTRWWPLVRSGIVSPAESVRVLKDLALPRLGTATAVGDRTVGEIVGNRLGRTVVERLADPLIGGIHAGNADELSAAATFPVLIAADHLSGSLMRRLGAARARATPPVGADGAPAPVFWSLAGTTASLVDELGAALRARGVSVRTGTSVEAVDRHADGASGRARWSLTLGAPGSAPGARGRLEVDGLVLAAPAPEAAVLLAPHAPESAGILSSIRYASVTVITLALPEGSTGAPLRGTGFLVPRTSTVDGRPALITGCTYLGRKWPHLARPGDELLRVSVGRFGDERHTGLDDEQLVSSVRAELRTLLGVENPPVQTMVTRWDGAFPQYEVGHLIRVARVEQEVGGLPAMAVAGAALRGVGLPACIGSGRDAARRVLASLAAPRAPDRGPAGTLPGS